MDSSGSTEWTYSQAQSVLYGQVLEEPVQDTQDWHDFSTATDFEEFAQQLEAIFLTWKNALNKFYVHVSDHVLTQKEPTHSKEEWDQLTLQQLFEKYVSQKLEVNSAREAEDYQHKLTYVVERPESFYKVSMFLAGSVSDYIEWCHRNAAERSERAAKVIERESQQNYPNSHHVRSLPWNAEIVQYQIGAPRLYHWFGIPIYICLALAHSDSDILGKLEYAGAHKLLSCSTVAAREAGLYEVPIFVPIYAPSRQLYIGNLPGRHWSAELRTDVLADSAFFSNSQSETKVRLREQLYTYFLQKRMETAELWRKKGMTSYLYPVRRISWEFMPDDSSTVATGGCPVGAQESSWEKWLCDVLDGMVDMMKFGHLDEVYGEYNAESTNSSRASYNEVEHHPERVRRKWLWGNPEGSVHSIQVQQIKGLPRVKAEYSQQGLDYKYDDHSRTMTSWYVTICWNPFLTQVGKKDIDNSVSANCRSGLDTSIDKRATDSTGNERKSVRWVLPGDPPPLYLDQLLVPRERENAREMNTQEPQLALSEGILRFLTSLDQIRRRRWMGFPVSEIGHMLFVEATRRRNRMKRARASDYESSNGSPESASVNKSRRRNIFKSIGATVESTVHSLLSSARGDDVIPSEEMMNFMMESLFSTTTAGLYQTGVPSPNACFQKSLLGSFALLSSRLQGMCGICVAWSEFVARLRVFWENRYVIPGIESVDRCTIELNACLIAQKLHLLNRCIVSINQIGASKYQKSYTDLRVDNSLDSQSLISTETFNGDNLDRILLETSDGIKKYSVWARQQTHQSTKFHVACPSLPLFVPSIAETSSDIPVTLFMAQDNFLDEQKTSAILQGSEALISERLSEVEKNMSLFMSTNPLALFADWVNFYDVKPHGETQNVEESITHLHEIWTAVRCSHRRVLSIHKIGALGERILDYLQTLSSSEVFPQLACCLSYTGLEVLKSSLPLRFLEQETGNSVIEHLRSTQTALKRAAETTQSWCILQALHFEPISQSKAESEEDHEEMNKASRRAKHSAYHDSCSRLEECFKSVSELESLCLRATQLSEKAGNCWALINDFIDPTQQYFAYLSDPDVHDRHTSSGDAHSTFLMSTFRNKDSIEVHTNEQRCATVRLDDDDSKEELSAISRMCRGCKRVDSTRERPSLCFGEPWELEYIIGAREDSSNVGNYSRMYASMRCNPDTMHQNRTVEEDSDSVDTFDQQFSAELGSCRIALAASSPES